MKTRNHNCTGENVTLKGSDVIIKKSNYKFSMYSFPSKKEAHKEFMRLTRKPAGKKAAWRAYKES